MSRKIFLLAAVLSVGPVLPAAGAVYKWTDENGVTHFGDRQPTGTRAEPISLRTLKPSTSNTNEYGSPQERLKDLESRQGKASESARLQAQHEAQEKQRKANCATAEDNLRILRTKGRIRIDEGGEQRYLTPEEIAEQRENFEAIASENCNAVK